MKPRKRSWQHRRPFSATQGPQPATAKARAKLKFRHCLANRPNNAGTATDPAVDCAGIAARYANPDSGLTIPATSPRTEMSWRACSFDHLVGAPQQRKRHANAQGFGRLEVDEQFNLRDLLDRQVCRLVALEQPSGLDASLTMR